MNTLPADTHYTLRSVAKMLHLSSRTIASLIDHGFVTPARDVRNRYRFSFQDIVVLRTAYGLRQARIPPRRMFQSLTQLRAKLPPRAPLSSLRVQAIGNDVVVRDASDQWKTVDGQLLLDFEIDAVPGTVSTLQFSDNMVGKGMRTDASAMTRKFNAALDLEEQGNVVEAEATYRQVLAADATHEGAYVNLGAMLCELGRCQEGVALLEEAIQVCGPSSMLFFNRAIALEDLGRDREALACYEQCLELEHDFVDAHHNAAMLNEKLGDTQRALRHYSALRRLSQAKE